MAKTWYPVIDYMLCEECGACSGMCAHGVYELTVAPTPRVIHPENCIDHCHGCGNKCPDGAITYVGDDTGWVPPARQGKTMETAGGGCGGATAAMDKKNCGCGCGND